MDDIIIKFGKYLIDVIDVKEKTSKSKILSYSPAAYENNPRILRNFKDYPLRLKVIKINPFAINNLDDITEEEQILFSKLISSKINLLNISDQVLNKQYFQSKTIRLAFSLGMMDSDTNLITNEGEYKFALKGYC